jgi:hypothetical protein
VRSKISFGRIMGLLDAYKSLAESVTWRHKTSIDQYGDPTYTDKTITVVWFDEQKTIYGKDQVQLLCDSYFLTDEAIVEGDAIARGGLTYPVIGISSTPTFGSYGPKLVGMGKA